MVGMVAWSITSIVLNSVSISILVRRDMVNAPNGLLSLLV
jgi:hypothetical protein